MDLLIQLKVMCPVCSDVFVTDDEDDMVPPHNHKDKLIPCEGSGKVGMIIDRRAIPRKK